MSSQKNISTSATPVTAGGIVGSSPAAAGSRPPAGSRPSAIIAVTNQKGGVGKTTTAVNLSTALAGMRRVLVVDADPQGNASTGLGIDSTTRTHDLYAALSGQAILSQAIRPTAVHNLDIIPAAADLSALEVELASLERREHRLAELLIGVKGKYDYIFIDCPPSLGLITVNALVAADSVLVPLQCEYYALEGLGQLIRTIEAVRGRLNPRLTIKGVVLTMYDSRNRLSALVAKDVKTHLPDLVYDTIIPRNVRLAQAPSFGKPALLYDRTAQGVEAYNALGLEVIGQEDQSNG